VRKSHHNQCGQNRLHEMLLAVTRTSAFGVASIAMEHRALKSCTQLEAADRYHAAMARAPRAGRSRSRQTTTGRRSGSEADRTRHAGGRPRRVLRTDHDTDRGRRAPCHHPAAEAGAARARVVQDDVAAQFGGCGVRQRSFRAPKPGIPAYRRMGPLANIARKSPRVDPRRARLLIADNRSNVAITAASPLRSLRCPLHAASLGVCAYYF
jgi:hypothetical protein